MKHIRSSAAILISVILLLALPVCSNALGDGRDFYVDDGAEIISSSDRERIIEMNEALFAMTGAEIVVVTVNKTPDGNVFSAAKEILENESIGSAERSNGMVLLYSKEESNYWFLPDSGAAEVLDTASVKTLCSSVLEPGLASSIYSLAIVYKKSARQHPLFRKKDRRTVYGASVHCPCGACRHCNRNNCPDYPRAYVKHSETGNQKKKTPEKLDSTVICKRNRQFV